MAADIATDAEFASLLLKSPESIQCKVQAALTALAENDEPDVDLSRCQLKTPLFEAILERIPNCSLKLNLDGNQLNDLHLEKLQSSRCLTRLKSLAMGFNKLTAGCADTLQAILHLATCLEELHLNHNRLDNDGAKGLADGLRTSASLARLTLTKCHIGDAGIHALMGAVTTYQTGLTHLDLSNNRFGEEGLATTFAALPQATRLQNLTLRSCEIRSADVVTLQDSLEHGCALVALDLRNNRIGDKGLNRITTALQQGHTQLKSLDVQKNDLSDDSLTSLLACVTLASATLHNINLTKNPKISDASMDTLQEINACTARIKARIELAEVTCLHACTNGCRHGFIAEQPDHQS
eukprot:TRINITY_DN7445_c0_g2_i2.p1 TRINITY_DN7445_c0_g2~~TRINITY_DN7445_c0_g2_i2.p1  ORF type:complete len:352 (+),score=77.71 TRINITY_DN7445_c0_g2_i2:126-1181(+)